MRVHPDSEFGYIHTDEVAHIVNHLLEENSINQTLNVCGEGLMSVRQLMQWTGRPDAQWDPQTKPIRYEINNRRLASFWNIPTSSDAAKTFIQWWKEQRHNG